MSKKKKITLISAALVLVIIVALVWANFDLILVVKNGLLETTENIDLKKEETVIKEKEALKEAGIENVRPLTEEEKKEYVDGNITKEEAVDIITGKSTIEDIKSGKANGDTAGSTGNEEASGKTDQPPVADSELNDKIAGLIGQVYVLEAKFTSELSALEQWAVKQYNATPKEEKAAKKKELASYGWPKLTALEKECDANIKAILDELKAVLEAAGQSTALVDQIDNAYNEKKQLTKARYISEYL